MNISRTLSKINIVLSVITLILLLLSIARRMEKQSRTES